MIFLCCAYKIHLMLIIYSNILNMTDLLSSLLWTYNDLIDFKYYKREFVINR